MLARPNLLWVTRLALRVLTVLNILFGIGLAVFLVISLAAPEWLRTALTGHADAPPSLITGMRLVIVIGLAGVPLGYLFLVRLLAMVDSVRDGDPFIPENARRLQVIARAMLGIQLLNLAEGAVSTAFSSPGNQLDAGWDPSVDGWLAVLLLFVLARVFDVGTRMRADLDGTV
jgi:hypothetical protein